MITYGSTTLANIRDGEDGTSVTITSTSIKYQKGTSGTTKPTGTWQSSIPSIGENEYLWTQTIVNYSDGSKTEAYSVSRNAKNGTSPTVSSTVVEYQQSTGGTTPPTGTWSSTAPTATAGQYMWTKTTITYSDGKTAVSYSVSKNGSNGINGIDGTSQNLLLDVYASSLTKVKAPWDRYLSDATNTTITGEFIAESNLPDPNATHFYRITDSSASTKGRALCFYNGGTPPFLDGHTYRIGCWVRNHAGQPRLFIYLGGIGSWSSYKTITSSEWQWVECIHTFGDLDPTVNTLSATYKRLYFYNYNNNVEGSSLDMCGFKVEEIQTDISTARNILLKTEKLENWGAQNGATISDGIATFPEITENTTRRIYSPNFKYELIRNQNVIFSVRVKADVGKICACNLYISLKSTESATNSSKWYNNYVYFTGTGEWKTICIAAPITDEWFYSGTGSPDYDNCWAGVGLEAPSSYHNGFQLKQPQLSLGTTATAWSAAPEDIEASMQEKVDNIEIGGRNILLNSATNFPQKYGSSTLTTQSNVAIPEFNCIDGLRCYGKTGTGNNLCLLINSASHGLSVSPATSVQGQQYVLSMYIKNNHETNPFFANSNIPSVSGTQSVQPGEAKRVVFYATGNNYHVIQIVLKTNAAEDDYDITFWHPQIELGNKVTDWSPAPEDTDASIQQVQNNLDNLEIGGRNLLYNSATMPAISNGLKGWRASGGTVTHIDLTNPPIHDITGAIRVTNTSSSAINIGIAQDRITNKFITGEKYSQSCWVRASETLRVYLSPIWASSGQATGGSSSVMDYFSIGTEWTYIKWEGAVLQGAQATSYSAGYVYAYQAPASSWFEVCGMKLEKGAKATDWTPAPEDTQADIDTALAQSIWYATCSTAGATLLKEATITPVTTNFKLGIGTAVNVKFDNTNSGARASLTLNVNNTGAKNIKFINNNSISDIPGNGYILGGRTYLFIYDGTYWVIQNLNYNSNETNHVLNNFSGKTGELGIWQTGLFMRDSVGTYQNICTNSAGVVTRTAEYNKKANTKGFEIGSSIYFSPSNTYGANANITGAVYASYGAFDSRYSLNAEGANALTAYMPIYLRGAINDIDGLFHLDTVWWTQTPTDSDKVYVLIGGCYDYYHTSSADYWRITLYEQNNWYKYVNGALVDYSNNLAELAATTATAFIAVDTDNNGIMVHPEDDMSSGWQIGTAINLVKGGLNYLKLWFDNLTAKIRIGNEEENHLLIDNEGLYFNGVENNEIKELAAFKATGISFNNETPYKIGNDDTYIRFEDTNNDGKADKLSIVADSISFADSNETVQAQLENLQNGFDSIQNNNYIKIIPSEPSITIAADSNESISSLKLTSDKLSFMVQDNEIAYMANDQMDIPTASVTNLFMQSADNTYEKLWVMRSNGHLSLKTVKKD